jgi:GNAT superfamily N-acetyltransferase
MASHAVIRAAIHDDLEGVLELYRFLNPKDPVSDDTKVSRVWRDLLDSKGTTIFVAELGNTLVATCTLTIVANLTRGARPYAIIENVVTHAGHRRAGFGRSIMEAALKTAWEQDCYKVMLASGRRDAIAFYESVGLKQSRKNFFEARKE